MKWIDINRIIDYKEIIWRNTDMKKIISIVLIVTMLFSFAVPVFAADSSVVTAKAENSD